MKKLIVIRGLPGNDVHGVASMYAGRHNYHHIAVPLAKNAGKVLEDTDSVLKQLTSIASGQSKVFSKGVVVSGILPSAKVVESFTGLFEDTRVYVSTVVSDTYSFFSTNEEMSLMEEWEQYPGEQLLSQRTFRALMGL